MTESSCSIPRAAQCDSGTKDDCVLAALRGLLKPVSASHESECVSVCLRCNKVTECVLATCHLADYLSGSVYTYFGISKHCQAPAVVAYSSW